MNLVCLDLEGVLVPEIWISFSQATGIEELRLTTRDIPDYDALMRRRISILSQHGLKLSDIQRVIETMDPLPGARAFLNSLRETTQVIILSDTFDQFAKPLMRKLGWPTLFCNTLVIGKDGSVVDYTLRQKDGKKKAVLGLKNLGFYIQAVGDSYNDIAMLQTADRGYLFRPPAQILQEFPDLPVAKDYESLWKLLSSDPHWPQPPTGSVSPGTLASSGSPGTIGSAPGH